MISASYLPSINGQTFQLWASNPYGQRAYFARDLFTGGAAGTSVLNATPGQWGTRWNQHSAVRINPVISTTPGYIRGATNTGWLLASGTSRYASQGAQAKFSFPSDGTAGAIKNGFLALRIDGAADTGYFAGINYLSGNNYIWAIWKRVAGTDTILTATDNQFTISAGRLNTVKFLALDSGSNVVLELWVDGVKVRTATDSTSPITGAGHVGFRLFSNATDAAGPLIGDFVAFERPGVICCDGDSLTRGKMSSGDTGSNQSPTGYPAQLATMLGPRWEVNAIGVDGQNISTMISNAPTNVDTAFYTATKFCVSILGGGTNDIWQYSSSNSISSIYDRVKTYVTARATAGWDMCFAVTNMSAYYSALVSMSPSTTFDYQRKAHNEAVKTNYLSLTSLKPVGLFDWGNDGILGQDGGYVNLTFYNADQIHLTDAGYLRMAIIAYNAMIANAALNS